MLFRVGLDGKGWDIHYALLTAYCSLQVTVAEEDNGEMVIDGMTARAVTVLGLHELLPKIGRCTAELGWGWDGVRLWWCRLGGVGCEPLNHTPNPARPPSYPIPPCATKHHPAPSHPAPPTTPHPTNPTPPQGVGPRDACARQKIE